MGIPRVSYPWSKLLCVREAFTVCVCVCVRDGERVQYMWTKQRAPPSSSFVLVLQPHYKNPLPHWFSSPIPSFPHTRIFSIFAGKKRWRSVADSMDVDFWASKVYTAKHRSAVYAARFNSGTWIHFIFTLFALLSL